MEELDKEAWDFIVGNLAKVVEEGELCRLSADALATIIASDQITCEEEQVHLLQINSSFLVLVFQVWIALQSWASESGDGSQRQEVAFFTAKNLTNLSTLNRM